MTVWEERQLMSFNERIILYEEDAQYEKVI